MKHCLRTLLTVLLAISLTLTGLALAEEGLELGEVAQDAAIEAVEAPEALPELALDDGALAIEDVEPDAAEAEANASGEVKINKANFPAADFRKYVKAHFDTDGNGSLSEAEIEDAREIELRSYDDFMAGVGELKKCSTLKGIEYLTNLVYLWCPGCNIDTMDLSRNTQLENLNCSDNHLTALDLSKNRKLWRLDCYGNQLKKLDLSKNTKLTELMCGNNPMKALDVRKNTKLKNLWCEESQLSSLDVSRNKALKELGLYRNQLKKLDVSANTRLEKLYLSYNQLKAIDLSKNARLEVLGLYGNKLTALDLSKNAKLADLNCGGNKLKKLDVSKNKKLVALKCFENQLTALDVSKNKKLGYLIVDGNGIPSLDIAKCPALQKALKLEKRTSKGVVQWGIQEEYGWDARLSINADTKLTAGRKVLYAGK